LLFFLIQLTRGSRPLLQIQKLAKAWQEEEADEEKPNPVTQRVKVIMVTDQSSFNIKRLVP